jgi:hypothetical protein
VSETYTCASCGGVFVKGWSDEEARAEHEAVFGLTVEQVADPVTICDDCYVAMRAWWDELPPEDQAAMEDEARGGKSP